MPSKLSLSPFFVQDFEGSGPPWWSYYSVDDGAITQVPVEADGLGNHYLKSTGPWWLDGNHAYPGAGYLNLISVLFTDTDNKGVIVPDLRDVTLDFDIRSENFQLPAGANIYLWFQSVDTKLAWGEGNFVNYVNTSVPIQAQLVNGAWAHVSITLTTNDADWLALGSNPFREDTYSKAANITDALSGVIHDMGLVILLGNGETITSATGSLLIDNVELDQGSIARAHLDAASLTSAKALGLHVTPSDSATGTYEGHHIDVAYVGAAGTANETLQIVDGGSIQVSGGNLILDGNMVGSVSGGTAGSALSIVLTATLAAADVSRIIAAIGYANPAATADSVRDFSITLTDTGGNASTVQAELNLLPPIDDGSGNDVWQGTAADETFNGGGGSDTLHGGGGKDILIGGIGADALYGEDADDTLYGGDGNDTLVGGDGNDNLFGEAGTNRQEGGLGDDWYHVDSATDVIVELAGQGTGDRVFASVNYTLAAGTEIETFSTSFNAGTGAINLTGNELAQAIYGNDGNNILDGKGGADFLAGLLGDDWFYVDNAADTVYELAGQGTDRVFASTSYTLGAGVSVEKLTTDWNAGTAAINLTGNELANQIYGNEGANVLDGKGGVDLLVGGKGDDWYYVDTAADWVSEAANEGNDRVLASTSYTLAAGISVEQLTTDSNLGTAAINLNGNELGQAVYGNDGVNILDGKGGADFMAGLKGDDWFYVDNAGDQVYELSGEGSDRVLASLSYTLGAGVSVEKLTTTNNAGTAALNLTGNELAQIIYGNAGNNVLDGKAGADTLVGLQGDDWFYVDNAGDRVSEAVGEGNDRVFASTSYTLGAGVSVEKLTTDFNPGTNAINLTGNELAQSIYGNDGANMLDGKGGSDQLVGLGGADTFAFTSALGAGNVDTISDFQAGVDKIALDDAVFTGIGGLGALSPDAFVTGTAAQDPSDRVIYNNLTGALSFDADGSGAGAAVQFAILSPGLLLSASDFLVI